MSMQYYAAQQLGFILTLDELVETINLKIKQVLPEITEDIVTKNDISKSYAFNEFREQLLAYLNDDNERLTKTQMNALLKSPELDFLINTEITDDSYVDNTDILLLDLDLEFPDIPLEIIYWIPGGSLYFILTRDGFTSPQQVYDTVEDIFGGIVADEAIEQRTGIVTTVNFG